MARNYACLKHEYLEEMSLLTDAEFGRLCRALLAYSAEGKEGQLQGSERLFWPRVKMQEDRAVESYEAAIEQRVSAGRNGGLASAAKRSQAKPSGAKREQAKPSKYKSEYEYESEKESEYESNTPDGVCERAHTQEKGVMPF